MSANFDAAYDFTLAREGGFVLSTLRGDSGGQTYAGIARNKHPEWAGWPLIDQGHTDAATLSPLVKNFYYAEFWTSNNLEQLPVRIGVLAFDFAVNSGADVAIKKLQEQLLVASDGKLGPRTALQVQAANPLKLAMLYLAARLDYLNDLKAWKYFSEGWSQRIVTVMRFAAQ